jgi:hypothetical protein
MKSLMNKRTFFIILLILLAAMWLVMGVLAAPSEDAVVPTFTPTSTFTLIPPTALPPPTNTPTTIPYPAPTTQAVQLPTETAQTDPGDSNAPEQTNNTTAAAGSSVLGFLLCAGVIIVFGLAALNIWARRRP